LVFVIHRRKRRKRRKKRRKTRRKIRKKKRKRNANEIHRIVREETSQLKNQKTRLIPKEVKLEVGNKLII